MARPDGASMIASPVFDSEDRQPSLDSGKIKLNSTNPQGNNMVECFVRAQLSRDMLGDVLPPGR